MEESNRYLTGHVLIAMPHMTDPYFRRSVVLICAHDASGAMGVIINKPLRQGANTELQAEIHLPTDLRETFKEIYFGGPVSLERGFILHSADFESATSLQVNSELSLSSDQQTLEAIKAQAGPAHYRFLLGYAGWAAGQLGRDMENGHWLFHEVDIQFIFELPDEEKWPAAMEGFGLSLPPTPGASA